MKEDRLGGDDAVRPEFPDDPAELPRGERWPVAADLIALRREHPWLAGATIEPPELTNTRYLYRVSGGVTGWTSSWTSAGHRSPSGPRMAGHRGSTPRRVDERG